jgi:hypothetical protein
VIEGAPKRPLLAPRGFLRRRLPRIDDRMRLLGPLDPLRAARQGPGATSDFGRYINFPRLSLLQPVDGFGQIGARGVSYFYTEGDRAAVGERLVKDDSTPVAGDLIGIKKILVEEHTSMEWTGPRRQRYRLHSWQLAQSGDSTAFSSQ